MIGRQIFASMMKHLFQATILSIFLNAASFAGDATWSRVEGWPQLPEGWKLSKVSGVAADSRGRVYVGHRDTHPIILFDAAGKFLGTVGEKDILRSVYYDLRTDPPTPMERRPWVHGLHVDPWDNLWVTDVGRHLVMKFSPEGKLLLTLGTPDQSGETPETFSQPTHAVVAPSGHIYVSDGYGNSRVVKFSPQGKYLLAWGKKGSDRGDLHTPHALALDKDENVYVADRSNDRIQVFDSEGRFKQEWPGLHSVDGLFITEEGILYGGAGLDNLVLEIDLKGRVKDSWGGKDVFGYPHGLCLDSRGNLYVAEVGASRPSKYQIVTGR